jgi:hypothetical protein
MGYHTEFKGKLEFTTEMTATQLAALKKMLGEDCRDHPEYEAPGLYYIDLELMEDFSGLEWSGAEKTYDMEQLVNVVIKQMRKQWPEFGLSGILAAQGEDIEDRWELRIGDDGFAQKRKIVISGTRIVCPHCEGTIILEEAEQI